MNMTVKDTISVETFKRFMLKVTIVMFAVLGFIMFSVWMVVGAGWFPKGFVVFPLVTCTLALPLAVDCLWLFIHVTCTCRLPNIKGTRFVLHNWLQSNVITGWCYDISSGKLTLMSNQSSMCLDKDDYKLSFGETPSLELSCSQLDIVIPRSIAEVGV